MIPDSHISAGLGYLLSGFLTISVAAGHSPFFLAWYFVFLFCALSVQVFANSEDKHNG